MLQVGCKEVRASQGLIHLLQAVLGAGNHLNQGTFKGNAGGVQLPSAWKCFLSLNYNLPLADCVYTATALLQTIGLLQYTAACLTANTLTLKEVAVCHLYKETVGIPCAAH